MKDSMYGYAGKILILDLTNETSETIDTEPYAKDWVAGHGIATKLFWDYCKDKTIDALDPGNVIAVATSPFTGSLVPSGGGRIEFTGLDFRTQSGTRDREWEAALVA